MIISYHWLQDHIEEKLPSPEVLKEKIIFHAFEVESTEVVGDDTLFDIKVLPDRAGDCLSHYGIAREIAGLFGLTLKGTEKLLLPNIPLPLSIEIKSELCRRYCAVQIDGVTVGPSPDWLKTKLETVGQKSINNIVDITNFILLDRGQPIHAFDTKEIDGGIVVRLAHTDEKIITLSNEEKQLLESDLVIADYLGVLAIAGVKGGKEAEVTAQTTSIVLEVANFDPVAVRKTSRRLNIITDASKRFENNVSPEGAGSVAAHAAQLIIDIAGGEIVGSVDHYPQPQQARTVTFTLADITKILGQTVTTEHIETMVRQYRYIVEQNGARYTVAIPSWRADISTVYDIAEEVGRVRGYDAIPAKQLPFTLTSEPTAMSQQIDAIRAWCISEGYREVYTYTFRKKGDVYIAHGSKDKSALRSNLSDGLKESFELNRLNAPLLGLKEVKLFEIGTVFPASKEEARVAVVDRGMIQEQQLTDFIAEKKIPVPAIDALPDRVPQPIHAFVPWSSYPFITRDVAVWVKEDHRVVLQELLDTFAQQHCVRDPFLFDEFSKDGRTSVAYRFIFQAPDHTLTDEEVSAQFATLLDQIRTHPAFELR